jgi:hypothetical protein
MRNIEVNDDPEYQRKTEIAQRIGWVFMAIFLVAAVAGFLGQSRFSTREVSEQRMTLEYDKFIRTGTETELKVTVHPKEGATSVAFWVPRSYLDEIEIEHALPEPERTETSDDGVRFFYPVPPGGKPVEVVITIVPQKPGRFRGLVTELSSSSALEFDQVAYF